LLSLLRKMWRKVLGTIVTCQRFKSVTFRKTNQTRYRLCTFVSRFSVTSLPNRNLMLATMPLVEGPQSATVLLSPHKQQSTTLIKLGCHNAHSCPLRISSPPRHGVPVLVTVAPKQGWRTGRYLVLDLHKKF